jgi:alpha-D-xyloside xylohydrolase
MEVYLPEGTKWYDFWTQELHEGGKEMLIHTQFNRIPLFVRAGSIIPLGPDVQYADEKAWDNLEVRIYPGADGTFTLYEDEGDGYQYEQGVYSEIPFTYNEARRTLSIGKRTGNYPGMLTVRRFRIVLPDGKQHMVTYKGNSVKVKL